jgi:hypothetical protein
MEKVAAGRLATSGCVAQLARSFPAATPVRIPVRLVRIGSGDFSAESTVIEFGTPREVLFASALPLEFAEKIRLSNSDGSLDVEASVVALQYDGGRTAVAARFSHEVAHWIVKP